MSAYTTHKGSNSRGTKSMICVYVINGDKPFAGMASSNCELSSLLVSFVVCSNKHLFARR